MHFESTALAAAVAICLFRTGAAVDLNVTDPQSIKTAAAALLQGVLSYYQNYNTSNGIQDWQVGVCYDIQPSSSPKVKCTDTDDKLFPFLPYYWWGTYLNPCSYGF